MTYAKAFLSYFFALQIEHRNSAIYLTKDRKKEKTVHFRKQQKYETLFKNQLKNKNH